MNTSKVGGFRGRRVLLTSMAAIGLLLGGVVIASAATSPSPVPTQAPVSTSPVPAPTVTEAPETMSDHCWNDEADANETHNEADANETHNEADANETHDKADANETHDKADANEGKCDAVAPSTTIG